MSNIEKITSVKKTKSGTKILLNGVPYVSINNQEKVKYQQSLTSFETRLFAQGKKTEALPFARFDRMPAKLKQICTLILLGPCHLNNLLKLELETI